MIGHIIFLISFASVVLMTAYLSTTAEYYRRISEKWKIEADFVKKENGQLINRLLNEKINNRSLTFQKGDNMGYYADLAHNLQRKNERLKEKIKNARKKLFNILSEYEIGNYDNNTHQFYEDVYDVHNELMELAE